MRTTKSAVTFRRPFVLNEDVGELPAGSYDVEMDEEEMSFADRLAYRRVATHFYVRTQGSMRVLTIDPLELEAALARDSEWR